MKLVFFTMGGKNHASSRIRAYDYASFFEEKGYNVSFFPRIPDLKRTSFFNKVVFFVSKRFLLIKRVKCLLFKNFDSLVVQKTFLSKFERWILKVKNIDFIFDFDDAIYLKSLADEQKTRFMLEKAKAVWTSNNTLSSYAMEYNANTLIAPTPVNSCDFETVQHFEKNSITIGWIGSPSTQHFLHTIDSALCELTDYEKEITLHIVGAASNLNLSYEKVHISDWYLNCESSFLRMFDIGVMPLTNDKYSEGKGGYKLLLYMSAGLPVIASPIGVNVDLVKNNATGFLASEKEEWVSAIKALSESAELRNLKGQQGKELIEQQYDRKVVFEKIAHNLATNG